MAVDCLLWQFDQYGVHMVGENDAFCFLECSICGSALRAGQDIQFDHIHADVFDGPHEYQNLRPLHAECHKKKTAQDVKANAKVKRIIKKRERPKPKRQIQSPGFRRDLTKGFDGNVRKK